MAQSDASSHVTQKNETSLLSQAFVVQVPGILSLIQDAGRFGQTNLGLTEGGPADKSAFDWCHKLLGNRRQDTAIEISLGGLVLECNIDTVACITGADLPVTLNGRRVELWQTFDLTKGDILEFGFSQSGIRSYFSVRGGFDVKPQFGSCATVIREGIGGLDGGALKKGDVISAKSISNDTSVSQDANKAVAQHSKRQEMSRPTYAQTITLRVVLGYQNTWFDKHQLTKFLTSDYQVSSQFDRMGYRLSGPAVSCENSNMYSEGIALGSVQIPADGQPIVLMHDRQTIGGYPKIGTVLSLDLGLLSQCKQGDTVRFDAITIEDAHNLLHLEKAKFDAEQPVPLD